MEKEYSRQKVVDTIRSWIGKNEADGSYKTIIDTYNSFTGAFPRGVKMEYNWAWCACTWSAVAIKLGYTDVMPIEISCGYLVEKAKKMGIWKENDAYIPKPGDAILYYWRDTGNGDCTGWADHIGIVEYVNEVTGYITTIEGNRSKSVKRCTIAINGKFIMGYITPKYTDDDISDKVTTGLGLEDLEKIAHEVIVGKWGNGEDRKNKLTSAGYDYTKVQALVNDILNNDAEETRKGDQTYNQPFTKLISTGSNPDDYDCNLSGFYKATTDVYCRHNAGSDKKAMCIICKDTVVECESGGYINRNGTPWYLVSVIIDGTKYEGYTCSKYLKKMS